MKYSLYNNTLVISPAYGLIYNTYTNMYVILRINQYNAFLTLSIDQLKNQHPRLFSKLIEAGCVIDKDINDVQLLQDRIKSVDNQNQSYSLTVNPTMNCNFKCWYCYESHVKHSKMSPQILEHTKNHIIRVLSEQNWEKFHLGFFGGEPLLYYKDIVYPLSLHLQQACEKSGIPYSIGITSNGYLLTDSVIEEMQRLKVTSFQITLDGDKDTHNKTRYPYIGGDSYTRILENVKKLLHTNISVVLRINYTKDNLPTTKNIINDLWPLSEEEKKILHVDFQQVWQDSDNNMIVQELLEECKYAFEKNGIMVSTPIMNQVWNSCYADKEQQALINYNGDVYKCTARDFVPGNRLGVLNEDGTITWNEEKMKIREGIRLSKEVCQHCRIAPICGGTCAQRGLDSRDSNTCIRGLEESGKDNVVLNQFYYNIVKNEVSI